ncbi:AAA family ATPase [Desulfohalovibrio reitneri]|uniref:AAA family ATPase n=1 Tax=Desulfohalovibrio reitneri TaxID=1307759 RepID=UPI0004A73FF0|nr:AAA family ATPase [Desulfohalovibrio reitneri]
MLKRLLLTDFLAHESTEIELASGVTVLTGPNNVGKSAVVEALRCLAMNPTPKYFIRHGAKEARVAAELEDGTWVEWVRKPKNAHYRVYRPGAEEAEEYHKLKKGEVPQEVRDLLRLDPVSLETGDSIDVHIGNQREPIFLLNRHGGVVASFFAASTETAHLIEMQKALDRRVKEAKREERRLTGRMAELAGELDALADLPRLRLLTERAEAVEAASQRFERLIPEMERVGEDIARLRDRRAALCQRAEALRPLRRAPELFLARQLAEAMAERERLAEAKRRARVRADALSPLSSPPELFDTRALRRAMAELHRLRTQRADARARADILAEPAPPPAPHPVTEMEAARAEITRLNAQRRRLASRAGALGEPPPPPRPEDPAPLERLLRQVADLEAERKKLAADRDKREAELRRVRGEVEELLAATGACPLCGQEADAAHVLGELAAQEERA